MVAVYPLIVIPNTLDDYFYLPRYLILAVVSLISLFLLARDRAIPAHPVFIPLGLFIFFSSVSGFLAPNPQTAWIGYLRYSGLSTYFFCIFLFFLASRSSQGDKLIRYMVYCAMIVSLLALLQHFGINLVPHEEVRKGYYSYGTMGNPNFLGTYTVFILPAAIILYITERKKVWLVASAIIYSGLVVCLTRGAWLAFLFTFTVIVWYCIRILKNRKALAALVVVFIIVTVGLLVPKNSKLIVVRTKSIASEVTASVLLEDKGGSYRMFIWKEAVKVLPRHWAFGIGPDHFAYLNVMPNETTLADKVHNVYLELAVTMGMFALGSYLSILFFSLWQTIYKKKYIYFIMIFSYLVQAVFNIDVVLILPLFWIILGLSVNI